MIAFHLSAEHLADYLEARCGPAARASVEAHLLACAGCRADLARAAAAEHGAAGATDLDAAWARVRRSVEAEPAGRAARTLQRLGLHDADAVVVRAVAAGASQWTLAAALVMATAALAAGIGGLSRSWLPFVLLAPLWPPFGVAATYRADGGALRPFEQTTPYPPARMLLWRCAVVLVSAVPLTVGFGALIGGRGWLWASWLLPSAVCTLVVIIAATWVDPWRPAVAVSTVWAALVLAWSAGGSVDPPTSAADLQLACGALTLAGLALLDQRLRAMRPVGADLEIAR